jgi:hypothetical protein
MEADPSNRIDEEKEAAVVQCRGCGEIFAGRIDPDGGIRALGIGGQCCEGHGYQVLESPDEYTDD